MRREKLSAGPAARHADGRRIRRPSSCRVSHAVMPRLSRLFVISVRERRDPSTSLRMTDPAPGATLPAAQGDDPDGRTTDSSLRRNDGWGRDARFASPSCRCFQWDRKSTRRGGGDLAPGRHCAIGARGPRCGRGRRVAARRWIEAARLRRRASRAARRARGGWIGGRAGGCRGRGGGRRRGGRRCRPGRDRRRRGGLGEARGRFSAGRGSR